MNIKFSYFKFKIGITILFFWLAFSYLYGQSNVENYNFGVKYIKSSQDSAIYFFSIAAADKDSLLASKANYNLACVLLKEGKYESSLKYFKKALLLNPNDDNARYNYVYAKLKFSAQKEKKQNEFQSNHSNSTLQQSSSEAENKDGLSQREAERILDAAKQSEEALKQRIQLLKNSKENTGKLSNKRW